MANNKNVGSMTVEEWLKVHEMGDKCLGIDANIEYCYLGEDADTKHLFEIATISYINAIKHRKIKGDIVTLAPQTHVIELEIE